LKRHQALQIELNELTSTVGAAAFALSLKHTVKSLSKLIF
jgi:hypothetical protein